MNVAGPRWFPVYVGIGSNLDDPEQHAAQAITDLRALSNCFLTAVSSLYRSAPMGPADQPDYINAVAALLTTLAPHDFLDELQKIEIRHGRQRDGERWGPRTLDLDLLIFGGRQIADERLTVPHTGIAERIFVLLPLCELAPQLDAPGMGTVSALLYALDESAALIEKIEQATP